jgi:tetratricopeptide (TPR) repeat protein
MQTGRFVAFFLLCLIIIGSGCSADPNVKKQKYLESGNRYFEKAQYREAVIQFSNAVQVDPRFAAAHFRIAESYLKMKVWSDAYRELERTVELDPTNIKAEVDLAGMLIGSKAYDRAQQTLDSIFKLDPNSSDGHALLANLNRAQGKQKAAVKEMQQAISIDPRRADYYVQFAGLQAGDNDLPGAEASMKKALAVDQTFTPAITGLAMIYQAEGRWPEAEQQLRQGIGLQAKDLELRRSLARLYYIEQRKTDAEQVALQAKKDFGDMPAGYRFLGEYYVAIGDSDKAFAEFSSLYNDHPQDVNTEKDYIQLLLAHNRIDEATKLNDKILKKNPKDAGAQLLRGRILVLQQKYADAIPVLEGVAKNEADNAAAHYTLGIALNAKGETGRAEQEWRQAAQLAPQMNDAQLALAQVALRKGDLDLLEQAASQLIRNSSNNAQGYMLRAQAEIGRKQIRNAEADLTKAIELDSNNSVFYATLGQVKLEQGNSDEAQKLFEESLTRNPDQIAGLNGLVSVFVRKKQPQKALERVQAQIAKSPSNDAFDVALADLQVARKDYKAAEASLQKATELNRNNLSAFVGLERNQATLGEYDKATATANAIIQRFPDRVEGFFLAASLKNNQGDWQGAEPLYQKALERRPNFPPAANDLAYLLLQHGGNVDVALSLAQSARRGMPESPMATDTLAWAYYQKGAYAMARDLLQEAAKKAPESSLIQFHMGMVYQKQNNNAEAKAHLERALKIDPNSSQAMEIRKIISQLG